MVIWSGPAIRSLQEIHKFIAQDSEVYADTVVDRLIEKTGILAKFPRIGRVVPEVENDSIRELIVYSYRIMYEITGERIDIVAVVHSSRNFKPDDLP